MRIKKLKLYGSILTLIIALSYLIEGYSNIIPDTIIAFTAAYILDIFMCEYILPRLKD